jgi:competence protein ComEC
MNYLTNSHNTLSQDDQAGIEEKSSVVKIAFLDVGQGDTIVISCADTHEAIVVDCVDARAVQNYLQQEQIKYLRGIIITHLHTDHYKGVADLLNNCSEALGLQGCEVLASNDTLNPKTIRKLKPDTDGHSAFYEQPFIGHTNLPPSSLAKLLLWCEQNKLKCEPIRVTKRDLPFTGKLAKSLQLVHPYHADYDMLKLQGLNNTSVVLRITGSQSSALLTGDLEPSGWQQLQVNHPGLQSDVLKFPHHGGAWGDAETDMLLDAIKPSVVVISVGTVGEKYKHPNAHIFTALSKRPHIRVLCTQATSLCQESILSERGSVVDKFQAEATRSNQQFILSRDAHGCPCAGTVVIELGDKTRVLLPEITFHRESIIKPHFKKHKCEL